MTISKGNNGCGAAQPDSSKLGEGSTIRPVDFDNHPVFLRTYNCSTMQLEELASRVTAWIDAGVRQAVIFAPAGTGKTRSIRYLNRRLSAQFPEVGFVEMCAGSVRGAHGRDRASLEKHVMELVLRTGQRSVILWIDDSQLLDPPTEISFRRLQDQVKGSEIQLLTVLLGHPRVRILNQKRVSYASDFPTFVPSLPTEEFELHGIRSATEIEHCLKTFDNDCFPSDSGWSYTRFFLPRAYLNGLRLAAHAGELWQVFVDADRTTGMDTRTEVPMSYFARTIEHALLEGATRDCENMTIDREFWETAIIRSGWLEGQALRNFTRNPTAQMPFAGAGIF